MKTKYKHIQFIESTVWIKSSKNKRKTKVWEIIDSSNDDILGYVEWHSPWREYCSTTEDDVRISRSCHLDIADFIKQLMDIRKK